MNAEFCSIIFCYLFCLYVCDHYFVYGSIIFSRKLDIVHLCHVRNMVEKKMVQVRTAEFLEAFGDNKNKIMVFRRWQRRKPTEGVYKFAVSFLWQTASELEHIKPIFVHDERVYCGLVI